MSEAGLTPISRTIREALAARAIAAARRLRRLSYIDPVSHCPGTPRAISATFEDLRLNRITPAMLRDSGDAALRDIGEVLELYQCELADGRYADHAARVELCIEAVQARRSAFAGLPLVLLDIDVRGAAERALLDALKESSPAILSGRLGETNEPVNSALDSIQTFLLSKQKYPDRGADDSFRLFAASGEAIECVEIARRIHRLADQGTRFDGVAILVRDPQRYQPLIAEALRRAGVPAHFTAGARKPHPAGRAFLALLRCAEEQLSASTFAEYLSLGQLPTEEDGSSQPYRWEQMLVDAAVIGGRNRWERRLRGVVEEFRIQIDQASTEAEIEHLERQREQYERLAASVLPIIAKLDSLPSTATWGEWLNQLAELATMVLKDPDAVTDLLDSLTPMADLGPVDLADVLLTLQDELANRFPATRDSPYGKVWVGSIEEARGLSFDAVFVPGVNESAFPKPFREDPFLLDEARARLGLDAAPDDTALLRIAVACASKQLTVSYSRLDVVNGRQRVPSFFAFETFKAARGSDADIGAFREAVEEASGSRLGWPAPERAAEAIDDAEFDLAVLRPSFDSGGDGEGAYLMAANPHAARSLRARFRRWDPRHWTSDDGLIGDTVHDDALFEQYRPSKRASSPSVLQQFAVCPYRYALRSIVELHPMTRPAALRRMDPITRGQVFHTAQSRLLSALQSMQALPLTKSNSASASTQLDAILSSLKEEFAERLAPAIPQVWDADWESIRSDLRGWLMFKAEHDAEWTPQHFEWSFGLGRSADRDPSSIADPVQIGGGYRVKGAIDLIERSAEGALRVVDHKTGKPPDRPVMTIGAGEKLQPALYAMAVQEHFKAPVRGGRLFYCTLRGNYKLIDVFLSDDTKQAVDQFYSTLDSYLTKGFFPAAPRDGACTLCDYQAVCGPWEEERTGKKPQAELRGLTEIRDLP